MAENTQNGAGKESLFREKNLERIENPEKLNDYLRVTSPGVWLVLITVIVLLAGVCIWGFLGHIRATVPAAVITQDGESTCLVPESALQGVLESRVVTVDGVDYALVPSVLDPQVIREDTNVYTILAGKLSVGDIVYPVTLEQPLEAEGIAAGAVVTETLTPASLFFRS